MVLLSPLPNRVHLEISGNSLFIPRIQIAQYQRVVEVVVVAAVCSVEAQMALDISLGPPPPVFLLLCTPQPPNSMVLSGSI